MKKASAKRAVTASLAEVRAIQTRQDGAERVAERDIARRAYELYLSRGQEDGHDVDDWLRAEQTLRQTAAHGE